MHVPNHIIGNLTHSQPHKQCSEKSYSVLIRTIALLLYWRWYVYVCVCGFPCWRLAHSFESELGTRAHWCPIVSACAVVSCVCVRDVKRQRIHLLVVVFTVIHDRSVPFHLNISSNAFLFWPLNNSGVFLPLVASTLMKLSTPMPMPLPMFIRLR